MDGLDINSAVNRFYEILETFIDEIPKVHGTKRDYPVYFTSRLKKLIKKKANAKSRLNKDGNDSNKNAFSKLRKQVKKEIKICFSNYVNDCQVKLKSNTKCFFSFTKSLKKTNSLASSMKYGDAASNDRVSICNLFSNFFATVYHSNSEVSAEDGLKSFYESMTDVGSDDIVFSISDVQNVLKGFDINKVSSPDEIPMMFYKKLAESLALPLSILFNKSLKERIFPDRWKLGFISPIFKDGDRQDVTNYRAVSILCAVSKIFERLMFNDLFNKVKDKIHHSQHGFFAKRSTQSNLMEFITSVSQSMANGGQMVGKWTSCIQIFRKHLIA